MQTKVPLITHVLIKTVLGKTCGLSGEDLHLTRMLPEAQQTLGTRKSPNMITMETGSQAVVILHNLSGKVAESLDLERVDQAT